MPSLPLAPPSYLLAGRFRPLFWLACCFLVISTVTRVVLLAAAWGDIPHSPAVVAEVFAIGFFFDLLTCLYVGLPLVLLLTLLPAGWGASRPGRAAIGTLCLLLLALLVFVAVAEWTFWEEFQSRFNFIAVDYLVYTTEVLGNIRESYAVGPILAGIAGTTLAIFVGTRRWRAGGHDLTPWRTRWTVLAIWGAAAALGTWLVTADTRWPTGNHYADALQGNGIYEFFAAYRNPSLDYDQYYRTVAQPDADAHVRRTVATPDATFDAPTGMDRTIHNATPEQRLNVVLISIESFSAEFSGTYGRAESLTPNLDRLTPASLLFTQLYATGTRTVRGLEALSLSVPPTPGESIVKRPGNEHLFSLASVFNAKGYDSSFIYGGYGAFDNMNYFFGHNGYTIHDRAEVPSDAVHHATVWGVSDEDLYTMAMKTFDRSAAAGRPFFAHVMTTSNHRPYTFPEGRGAFKQKSRIGAVRYTDWAVGDFLRRARTHPWFRDTVFVITADHCAFSAGKADLPAFRYHIPMWVYSPAHIAPGRVDGLMSQIDVPPTLLGLLGMDYRSRFYGVDVAQSRPERALIGTYQLLGYLTPNRLVQLAPHRRVATLKPALTADESQPVVPDDPVLTLDAISYYESAAAAFHSGQMRTPFRPLPAVSAR
ncbi:LTA synthase family protein [Lysobacter sp. TY2-98]|uniref:LTA synthase family protein n=1 Tax=Lysobacter sp. TY2-98 TaxID=2290922 RepID=UPI000E20B3CC|nr:LTA synthase family protein [Lysobacter sp. TY2-98]AXK71187.1 LTA synthase family protein [Lysobacter sp. TY2-98]